jgi:mercuric ion binding protein
MRGQLSKISQSSPIFFALLFSVLFFIANKIDATENAEAKVVTLAVQNMTCAMCPLTVKKSLTQLPGVVRAEVSFEAKTATVTYQADKVSVENLTQATTHAGYPSTPK